MGVVDAWLRMPLSIALVFCLWASSSVSGAGLRDTVKQLWGGDGIKLQASPPPFPSHEPHFVASSLQGLDALDSALASNLRLPAFNSSVTGFTFDVERGVPVRTTESLGPLLAERATTLGARKLNLAFAYTRLDFKRFDGRSLSHLSLTFAHEDVNQNNRLDETGPFRFESDVIQADLDLEITEDIFAIFATYGLTRNWDVGVIVPFNHIRLRARAEATIVRNSDISALVHNFGPNSDPPTDTGGGERTGIGDVILRTKYNFVRNQAGWPDLAVVGEVKLPSGDADDLLGTGETNLAALLVASRSFGPLTPHLNLGFEWTTEGSEENNLRYVAGIDARVYPRLTLALDVLGRWQPHGDGIGDHVLDLALGAKLNIFRTFLLNANVQLPLNKDEGLRANVIWTGGVEYTF